MQDSNWKLDLDIGDETNAFFISQINAGLQKYSTFILTFIRAGWDISLVIGNQRCWMLWLWVFSFCLWIRDKFLSGHHLINWTVSLQRASPTTVVTVNRINLFNIINYPLNTVINLILDKLFVTILICTCLQSKKSDVFDRNWIGLKNCY